MFCRKCGAQNPDDSQFCENCGERFSKTPVPKPGKDTFSDTPVRRPVQESFAEGTLIAKQGRFQQMAKIGEGGMGRVYKAYDSVMEEWVALKTLPPELVDKPELLKRFIREAKETRKLSHPNIIRIHDVFEIDHILYIAMEFVDGIDLKSLIKEKGALPLDEVRELFQQICNGLSYAHSQGVIHRDIKPQNILIDKSGRAKITDFGIAKALETTGFTRTGQMLGTPAYMSPEQADAKNVDNRSDIYSLGVVLYEMLTGDIPFKADSPVAMGIKHLKETPPMPRQIRQDLPEAWEKIALKCLAKEPDERFSNIQEIFTSLHREEEAERQKKLQEELARKRREEEQRLQEELARRQREEERKQREEAEKIRRLEQEEKVRAVPETAPREFHYFIWGIIILFVAGVIFFSYQKLKPNKSETITEISGLLDQARSYLNQNKLTSPSGQCAYDLYKKVLELEPGNQAAIDGINEIKDKYLSWAEDKEKSGEYQPAKKWYESALKISPDDAQVWDKLGALNQKILESPPPPAPSPSGTKGGSMVKIPAGEFWMGCNPNDSGCQPDEKPYHKVYLDAYYIDKYEVTQGEYSQCVSAGRCKENTKYDGFTGDRQPVVGVDWNDADTYCQWAGKRLPTEAEWEKAARGTESLGRIWMNPPDCSLANMTGCGGKTKPVGSTPSGASPYGVMDMAGNVWEWVADWYDDNYYGSSPERNPKGPTSGTYKALRGGSWDTTNLPGPPLRSRFEPGNRVNDNGFRCSRD